MSTITPNYAAPAALTIGLASTPLASSGTLVAGRQSTAIDNSTNKYDDALLAGKIRVGTTPTTATQILVYVYAQQDDTPLYPDTITGSDGDVTMTSAGVRDGALRLAASLNVDSATSNRDYWFAPVSVAQLFGGILPKRWGVWVTHNTGVALNSTAGNHSIEYTGVKFDVA